MLAYSAALCAALCWAFGGLIAFTPVNWLGPIGFNRVRMPLVFIMLSILAIFTGGWSQVGNYSFWAVFFSSIVGIFLGDSALFYTMNKMGPRRTAMLFATNAPMTAVISFICYSEKLSVYQILGCSIVLLGVFLAIAYGTTANQSHKWEQIKGSAMVGVIAGLIAALCQASGAIIIKPVMEQGADPVAVSAYRVGISALFLVTFSWIQQRNQKVNCYRPLTPKLVVWVGCSGFVGMALGMTLLLYGLANGEAGIITTLSATTPVMMLPLLWIKTKERPSIGSWLGAIFTVIGSGILFNF